MTADPAPSPAMGTFYPESRFGGFTDVDGTVAFYSRVAALLDPSHTVLDVGCGRGEPLLDDPVRFRRELVTFKGRAAKVIGVDPDPAAASHPGLDEFHRVPPDEPWPIADGTVDLAVCDNVVEHAERPRALFAEMRRVLRPGGVACVRTPNRWGYVAVAASLIPNRLHAGVAAKVQESRKEEDVFPTLYRCNSVRKLRHGLKSCGFEPVVYGYGAEPGYLAFSKAAYAAGVLHQKLAPGFLRPALFAFARVPAG